MSVNEMNFCEELRRELFSKVHNMKDKLFRQFERGGGGGGGVEGGCNSNVS